MGIRNPLPTLPLILADAEDEWEARCLSGESKSRNRHPPTPFLLRHKHP